MINNKLKQLNWYLWETGGGCDGYRKNDPTNPDRYLLMTLENESNAPTKATQKVTIGIYDDSFGDTDLSEFKIYITCKVSDIINKVINFDTL